MLLKEEGWQGQLSFKKTSLAKDTTLMGFFITLWFIDNTS